MYGKLFIARDSEAKLCEQACTCGYHEIVSLNKKASRCPACGTDSVQTFSKVPNKRSWGWYASEDSFFLVKDVSDDMDDTSFSIEVQEMIVDVDTAREFGDVFHISCSGNRRRIDFRMVPSLDVQITMGGKKLNPTISNVKKALGHVSPMELTRIYKKHFPTVDYEKGKPLTIFEAMSTILNSTSMSTIASILAKFPCLEKFYHSDPKLHLYVYLFKDGELREGYEDLVDLEARRPHEILKVSKPMFHILQERCMQFRHCTLDLPQVWALINRYGMERAIHVLEATVRIANLNHGSVPFGWRNLVLDERLTYDVDSLESYLSESIYTYQGIEDVSLGSQLLYDYVNMCLQMGIKYERYPRSLKLAHDLTAKNYKVVLEEITRSRFHDVVRTQDYLALTYQGEDYVVIAPKEADDLIFEGAALNHCVGSYINDVVDKGVRIYFMRKKDALDEPLITLDVRRGSLTQAAGMTNRSPSEKEFEFISKWVSKNKLMMSHYIR